MTFIFLDRKTRFEGHDTPLDGTTAPGTDDVMTKKVHPSYTHTTWEICVFNLNCQASDDRVKFTILKK